MTSRPFVLNVETVAANMSEDDGVRALLELSNHLGIMVRTEINGVSFLVAPGMDAERCVELYQVESRANCSPSGLKL